MHFSTIVLAALASGINALAAPVENAAAAAVPASYKWSLTGWNANWYGVGWANFYISGPAVTSGGVTVPALTLTGRCSIVGPNGGQGGLDDCNDLIADNSDGSRKIEFNLRPFDNNIQKAQFDTTYTFKSGGR